MELRPEISSGPVVAERDLEGWFSRMAEIQRRLKLEARDAFDPISYLSKLPDVDMDPRAFVGIPYMTREVKGVSLAQHVMNAKVRGAQ